MTAAATATAAGARAVPRHALCLLALVALFIGNVSLGSVAIPPAEGVAGAHPGETRRGLGATSSSSSAGPLR